MSDKTSKKRKTTLIICIDRDNDIGEKAGIEGPIIGRKANTAAANKLALADAEDSDVNALFKTIQTYDELKKKDKVEIITLTGDRRVGMESDHEITRQFDIVLEKYHTEEAILISDGAEDEYILPILRTKIKMIYPKRVIIKQNQKLESTYYMIYEFIKQILNDPKASRFFIGIPAIVLLIYATFGAAGGRIILGTIGLYLFIKGFQLESSVEKMTKEFITSIRIRKSSFFMYLVGLVFLTIGAFNGYTRTTIIEQESILYTTINFIHTSIIFFFLSALFFGWGNILGSRKNKLPQYITYLSITFSVALITYTITTFILTNSGYMDIIYSIIVGGILLTISSIIDNLEKKRNPAHTSK
ncbi:MAG: DUF373 family protein [archaeon]|nr:DUF373 family protein [archaeon]